MGDGRRKRALGPDGRRHGLSAWTSGRNGRRQGLSAGRSRPGRHPTVWRLSALLARKAHRLRPTLVNTVGSPILNIGLDPIKWRPTRGRTGHGGVVLA